MRADYQHASEAGDEGPAQVHVIDDDEDLRQSPVSAWEFSTGFRARWSPACRARTSRPPTCTVPGAEAETAADSLGTLVNEVLSTGLPL
jgi:hypothetical protein